MNKTLTEMLSSALRAMGVTDAPDIEIEIPRDESFGDLSTPIAMILAKKLKRPPREMAKEIAEHLPIGDILEKVDIAGPGFINVTFSQEYLRTMLRVLLEEGPGILRHDVGKGFRVQVEFVSANPTGPLHLGHGRGAAVGGALCNLLDAAGYDVVKEYYVNDAGLQVKLLGESVFARYKELLGVSHPLPEDGYRGDYVTDIAQAVLDKEAERFKDVDYAEASEFFIDFSLGMMLDAIKGDLEAFGIWFDTWQSERELYSSGEVQKALDYLDDKGSLYEKDGALWFKAEDFGDEKDRVVKKSDGEYTYFASDIAYHEKKVLGKYDELVNIWGADHHGYIPRLQAVLDALGYDRKKLKVLLVQMVALQRAGKPVQMSKRAGEFVTLREVIDEVGADTTKFIFLTRRPDSQLTFDLEDAKATSSENPVFYVQYANARINSIFRHAAEQEIPADNLHEADLSVLKDPEELRLIKKLLSFAMVFESAALHREPHRITFYLQELAGLFHPFYKTHRVVTEDQTVTNARLALCAAVRSVLRDALGILGIAAPDRM